MGAHRGDDDRIRFGPVATAGVVLTMLAASATCVADAPLFMPDSYSPVEHSVSESAAQGVEHAWVARLGFLLLGFAVLILANAARRWGPAGRAVHRVYGVSIIAVAAFSHMPWEDVPFDAFEDTLHSVASSAVGAAFTIGVLAVTVRRGPGQALVRVVDWSAIIAAVGFSVMMLGVEGVAGLVQRIMFGVGYLWYGIEAVRIARAAGSGGK